jgi:hypothetical protein
VANAVVGIKERQKLAIRRVDHESAKGRNLETVDI